LLAEISGFGPLLDVPSFRRGQIWEVHFWELGYAILVVGVSQALQQRQHEHCQRRCLAPSAVQPGAVNYFLKCEGDKRTPQSEWMVPLEPWSVVVKLPIFIIFLLWLQEGTALLADGPGMRAEQRASHGILERSDREECP
jgi:hypothetical protein